MKTLPYIFGAFTVVSFIAAVTFSFWIAPLVVLFLIFTCVSAELQYDSDQRDKRYHDFIMAYKEELTGLSLTDINRIFNVWERNPDIPIINLKKTLI